ncbi:MAG TPA: right-handed parallel beta-helix repeat-containing protein [Dongiaceae bacterium]|nr:right-handed parallel beta-helix repeat-containing protein [Dongiaceae bacterium]
MAGLLTAGQSRPLHADALVPATVTAAAKPKSVQVFTGAGAGDKDGRDWQNAMPIGALNKALGRARPGAGFLIGFEPAGGRSIPLDKGQILIKVSGEEERPVFVQVGLIAGDHELAAAESDAPLFKSSKPWSVENFGSRGRSFFAIANGASHLRLSGFRIDGTPADGFFKFRAKQPATFNDIAISGIEARNVGRIIETERSAKLRNLLVSDCKAVGIVRGFARFRDLSDAAFRNLELDADNLDGGGKNVCQLIALSAGENILFENITLRNALNEPPPPKQGKEPGYVQGDGIVCERKTRNITVRNCHASNMGDGGFDLKSTNVTMEDCTTDSCKFGARIWAEGNNVIRRCDFRNPVTRNETMGACVQAGGTLEIIDSRMQAGPGTVAVSLSNKKNQKPPLVVVRGGSIETKGDGAVAHCNGDGVLEVYDVMVNGKMTTRRYVFKKKK